MRGVWLGAARLAAVFVLLVCAACVPVASAGPAAPAGLTREQLLQHRQQLVKQSLALDAAQQAAFDPVYAAYEAERTALEEERAGFVGDYVQAALAATPAQATDLTDRLLHLRLARVELDEKFRPRLAAVLPAQKVLLFLQVNFVMDAVVNYDLAGAVPLVK